MWKEAFLTIRFVVHTNVARIKLPSLTKQVQNNIYSFYKIPQALSKSWPSHLQLINNSWVN
jgi:Leucine-rich repeat (LRR) protein